MEAEQKKREIEESLTILERQIEIFSQKPVEEIPGAEIHDFKQKLDKIFTSIKEGFKDSLINYSKEISDFEQRYADLEEKILFICNQRPDRISINENRPINMTMSSTCNPSIPQSMQANIVRTDQKLLEGKNIAYNTLKTTYQIKEEIAEIEHEVLLQKEKLLTITERVQQAQSLAYRTKQMVSFFSKVVNEDKIMKILIILIGIVCLALITVAFTLKYYNYQKMRVQVGNDEKLQNKKSKIIARKGEKENQEEEINKSKMEDEGSKEDQLFYELNKVITELEAKFKDLVIIEKEAKPSKTIPTYFNTPQLPPKQQPNDKEISELNIE